MAARGTVGIDVEWTEASGCSSAFRFDAAGFRRRDSLDRPGFCFWHESACDGAATNRGPPTSGFTDRRFLIDSTNDESCKRAQRQRAGLNSRKLGGEHSRGCCAVQPAERVCARR